MGMAASQARLLSLTARIHDVEYSAQSVQNAKLQLATQQDDAYEAYQRALDATSLTFTTIDSSGNQSTTIANFNSLFSINAANAATGNFYALVDARGQVVVPDDIYEGYYAFMADTGYTQNAYNFAMFMTYGSDFEEYVEDPTNVSGRIPEMMPALLDMVNSNLPGEDGEGDSQLQTLLEHIDPEFGGTLDDTMLASILAGDSPDTQEFLNYFFGHYGQRMYNNMDLPDRDVNNFNYYVRMFNAIQEHHGQCISIDDFDYGGSSSATNSEWLTAMVQSGQMTIEVFNIGNHGDMSLAGTGVSSDQNLNYTTTTRVDKAALAKAEAEYEHTLKVIDRKDKKFDLELNKLETERNALTKQYDSVKKVIDDNVERTFGIFS